MSYYVALLRSWWHQITTGHACTTYQLGGSKRLDYIGCKHIHCKRVFWLSEAASAKLVRDHFQQVDR